MRRTNRTRPVEIDPTVWKRAADAPGRRCLGRALAIEMVFLTRNQEPYFGDPDLATCALERSLDEQGTLAVNVLPDRVWWMIAAWPGAESMRSWLCQTAEYAEIFGAPAGKVWPRGFWYRPITTPAEVRTRSEAIARTPMRETLVARFGRWPAGVSSVASRAFAVDSDCSDQDFERIAASPAG